MTALYKPRAKLPRDFVAHFDPREKPPLLQEVTAPLLAHLWDTARCVGHPVQPHVHVLQRRDFPGIKISIATNNYFIIVTATATVSPNAQLLLAADHYMIMLGANPHHLATWHRAISPASVATFLARMDEELIAHGILNPQTGRRKSGYTYVHGWTLEVPCAFPNPYSYINIRPRDDAGEVWRSCEPAERVTIVPDFFGHAVLCRMSAAVNFFDVLGHRVRRRHGTRGDTDA